MLLLLVISRVGLLCKDLPNHLSGPSSDDEEQTARQRMATKPVFIDFGKGHRLAAGFVRSIHENRVCLPCGEAATGKRFPPRTTDPNRMT
jgi:hypothetical protein